MQALLCTCAVSEPMVPNTDNSFSLDVILPIHPFQNGDDKDKYAQCNVVLSKLMVLLCGRLKQNYQQNY